MLSPSTPTHSRNRLASKDGNDAERQAATSAQQECVRIILLRSITGRCGATSQASQPTSITANNRRSGSMVVLSFFMHAIPCVAGAVLRPFADRRRLSAGVGPGRSRAAGRRGRLSFEVMFPAIPDARCMASPGVANRVAGRAGRGSVCHRKSRWAGGQAGTHADAATPGPRCSPS